VIKRSRMEEAGGCKVRGGVSFFNSVWSMYGLFRWWRDTNIDGPRNRSFLQRSFFFLRVSGIVIKKFRGVFHSEFFWPSGIIGYSNIYLRMFLASQKYHHVAYPLHWKQGKVMFSSSFWWNTIVETASKRPFWNPWALPKKEGVRGWFCFCVLGIFKPPTCLRSHGS